MFYTKNIKKSSITNENKNFCNKTKKVRSEFLEFFVNSQFENSKMDIK